MLYNIKKLLNKFCIRMFTDALEPCGVHDYLPE